LPGVTDVPAADHEIDGLAPLEIGRADVCARLPNSLFECRSSGGQYGLFQRLRQSDRAKERPRVKIVIPGLINYPELTMLFCGRIAKGNVDLPLFE
jgi:hypothetical protein